MVAITRTQYGKEEGSVISFKDAKNPLTIAKARTQLAEVEAHRKLVPISDPTKLVLKKGTLFNGSHRLGQMSGQAYAALKHHARVDTVSDGELITALRKREWKDVTLQARIDVRNPKTPVINGVLTDRYVHLPYHELLDGFPSGMIIPRMQVDAKFIQIHIADPTSLDKSDKIFMGARILGSDVGLCRATLLDEMLRLVCTNGMIRATLEAFWKRYHVVGDKPIREEWQFKVAAFLQHIKTQANVERKKIAHSRSLKVKEADARKELLALGLGPARIQATINYALTEFGQQLSRWSITQGITHASQFQRGEMALPTSIAVANDVDAIAAQYLAAA